MAEAIIFEDDPALWRCGNDYPTVYVTKLTGPGSVVAYLYTCNINMDYDGAPTAYGPPGKKTLDYLANAGPSPTSGWYGVISATPAEAAKHKLKIDQKEHLKDVKGRYPVIQQDDDPAPGYYVSATPHATGNRYKQTSYIDASAVPFGALSGQLRARGVSLYDFGLAVRHDKDNQSGFFFGDMGGTTKGTKQYRAVGECSYKVFTNLGGLGRNNNFVISYLVFPGTKTSGEAQDNIASTVTAQMRLLCSASNAIDLPLLMAFNQQAGKGKRGRPLLKQHKELTGWEQSALAPRNYSNIAKGLQAWGYATS